MGRWRHLRPSGKREHVWRGEVNGNDAKVSINHTVVDPFSLEGRRYKVDAWVDNGSAGGLGATVEIGVFDGEADAVGAARGWIRAHGGDPE